MITTLQSMHLKRTLVSDAAQETVAHSLQATLVDLLGLASQAKQAHWVVVGSNFSPIHKLLDEIVATLLDQADETAERLVAVNIAPDGRVTTVAQTTNVEALPEGPISDTDAVALIADRLAGVVARMRANEMQLRDADPVSDDMLIGFLGALEKHLWMLQAQVV